MILNLIKQQLSSHLQSAGQSYRPPPMGYPPQRPGQGYPPPPMGYPPQMPGQGYPPQMHGQGYPPQIPGQGYRPQMPGESHPPPNDVQGYPPQMPGQGYPQPIPGQGYPPPMPAQGYRPQMPGESHPPPNDVQGYPPQMPGQGYPQPIPGQGYPSPPLPGHSYRPPMDGGGQSYPPPMAAQNYPIMENPLAVVGQQYIQPHPMDLSISKKKVSIGNHNFAVTDVNGNTMFNVKGVFFSLRDRRVLLDASGQPLVSLQQKMFTAHRRWNVFRGESSNDLLFSVKKSSLIQYKTKLDVFLASNTKEDACDFYVKGSWMERSCTIHAGGSNTIVAQMHKAHNISSIVLGKEYCPFAVTVYPNIDYAFIIALVVVLNEINVDRKGKEE